MFPWRTDFTCKSGCLFSLIYFYEMMKNIISFLNICLLFFFVACSDKPGMSEEEKAEFTHLQSRLEKGIPSGEKKQMMLDSIDKHKNHLIRLLYANGVSADEYLLLHRVVQSENREMTEYFLVSGSDKNFQDENGLTPLMVAGNSEIAALLLAKDAAIEIKDHSGKTALYHAVENNRLDVVRLLDKKYADPFSRANNGKSPLDLAKEMNSKAVEILTK